MKFLLGTKGKMTQIFDEKGVVSAATLIKTGPITVTQVKDTAKDGYEAVQIGYGVRKANRTNKPLAGHLKDISPVQYLREFTPHEGVTLSRGDTIEVGATFAIGDTVTVSATSKGKGFQGVVKRHGFHGGPRSHGQKNKERSPGSLSGGGRAGGRVAKNMKMAGRMGGDRITVQNLKVLQIDAEANTILISGAVPGRPGTLVEIYSK